MSPKSELASIKESLTVVFRAVDRVERSEVRTPSGTVDPKVIRLALEESRPDGVSWTESGSLTVTGITVEAISRAVSQSLRSFMERNTMVTAQILGAEKPVRIVTAASLLTPIEGDLPPEIKAEAESVMREQRKLMN